MSLNSAWPLFFQNLSTPIYGNCQSRYDKAALISFWAISLYAMQASDTRCPTVNGTSYK